MDNVRKYMCDFISEAFPESTPHALPFKYQKKLFLKSIIKNLESLFLIENKKLFMLIEIVFDLKHLVCAENAAFISIDCKVLKNLLKMKKSWRTGNLSITTLRKLCTQESFKNPECLFSKAQIFEFIIANKRFIGHDITSYFSDDKKECNSDLKQKAKNDKFDTYFSDFDKEQESDVYFSDFGQERKKKEFAPDFSAFDQDFENEFNVYFSNDQIQCEKDFPEHGKLKKEFEKSGISSSIATTSVITASVMDNVKRGF